MKKQNVKKSSNNAEDNQETKANENLPGYPHYPSSEDIMNSSEEKIGIDLENVESPLVKNSKNGIEQDETENEIGLKRGTSADVTKADLDGLEDDGYDQQRLFSIDMEAKDLIIPGTELDDAQEEIGSEDEENNFYSRADN